VERIEDLVGGWPEDEIDDGFEEALLRWRGHSPDEARADPIRAARRMTRGARGVTRAARRVTSEGCHQTLGHGP
jgi:hypothetical protein